MNRESRSARRRRERAAAREGDARRDERAESSGAGGSPGEPVADITWGDPLPWWRIAAIAALFALVVGFIEGALVSYVVSLGIPLRVSPHYLWMAPAACLLAAAIVALPLIGFGRLWPRATTPPVVVSLFAGLAVVSFLLAVERIHPLAVLLLAAGIAVQLGRLARGRFGAFLERVAPAAVLVLATLLAGVTVWSLTADDRAESRAHAALAGEAADGPNVLLILLDTVRAASLGLYDATRPNTPNLERFAAEGAVFDRAYAPSPWTLPSHATVFTGVWPHVHGADWYRPLDRRHPTLAAILGENGYATAGFVGNLTWASRNHGLDHGFARYEDYPVSLGQIVLSFGLGRSLASVDRLRAAFGLRDVLNRVPARAVTDRFLAWHERDGADRPFFAFLNYFDAHEPLARLVERESLTSLEHRAGLVTGAVDHFVNRPGVSDVRFLREYAESYEATIADLDRELGRLFEELERQGVLDNTLVVVTSDHGELIGEYGLFGHTSSLYLPTLHVPLLVRYPRAVPAGERIGEQVSLRDLAATVVGLAGLGDAVDVPGRSLIAPRGEPVADSAGRGPVYARLTRGPDLRIPSWAPVTRGGEMESVIDGGLQYIRHGDGTEEVYEIGSGAAPTRDLADSPDTRQWVVRTREVLRRVRSDAAPGS